VAGEGGAAAEGHHHWRDLAGLAISLACLVAVGWWASQQDPPELPGSLRDLLPLGAAVGAYAGATLLRGWRWHVILRRAGVEHRPSDAYALTVVGYMGNTVLPARGGEVLRVALLGARSESRRREILGTIVAERVLDALTLVALFALLTFASVGGRPLGTNPALIALAATAAALLVAAAARRLPQRGLVARVADAIRPVARASHLLVGRLGAELALVTALVWVIEGTICWMVALSLNVELSILEGTLLIVLASFFALVPAAPGYVGTFDAAILLGLRKLDVAGGAAFGLALLVRFVLFVPITLAGLVILVVRYGGLARVRAAVRRRPIPET
jgi:uncharacterized membrane protein YbhN (UPF0104 family)